MSELREGLQSLVWSEDCHKLLGLAWCNLCMGCHVRFWSKAALQRHAVAHDTSRLSIRKAVCSVCSLAFRHVYNLSHHITTTHADATCKTPYACATCRQQFDSGLAFKTHYRSKHRNRWLVTFREGLAGFCQRWSELQLKLALQKRIFASFCHAELWC